MKISSVLDESQKWPWRPQKFLISGNFLKCLMPVIITNYEDFYFSSLSLFKNVGIFLQMVTIISLNISEFLNTLIYYKECMILSMFCKLNISCYTYIIEIVLRIWLLQKEAKNILTIYLQPSKLAENMLMYFNFFLGWVTI